MGTNAKSRSRIVRQIIWMVSVVAVVVMGFGAYVWTQVQEPLMRGSFESADGHVATFNFELRHTCAGRQEGLMFRRREDFPDDRAMLFLFTEQSIQSFWMVNTLIPLDMVFLDRNLEVVGVLPNVPPLNRAPRAVERPSQYVVELNAGTAEKKGIVVGNRLKMGSPLPRAEACR